MAPNDHESELSEAPATLTTPLIIAAKSARSTVSSRSAKHTRKATTRRGLLPPKNSQKKPTPQAPILRASDDHSRLAGVPVDVPERQNDEEESSGSSTASICYRRYHGGGRSKCIGYFDLNLQLIWFQLLIQPFNFSTDYQPCI